MLSNSMWVASSVVNYLQYFLVQTVELFQKSVLQVYWSVSHCHKRHSMYLLNLDHAYPENPVKIKILIMNVFWYKWIIHNNREPIWKQLIKQIKTVLNRSESESEHAIIETVTNANAIWNTQLVNNYEKNIVLCVIAFALSYKLIINC